MNIFSEASAILASVNDSMLSAPVLTLVTPDADPALSLIDLAWDGDSVGEWDLYESADGEAFTYVNSFTGVATITFSPVGATQRFIRVVGTNDGGEPGTPVTGYSNAVDTLP